MDRRNFLKISFTAILALFLGRTIKSGTPPSTGLKEARYYKSPDNLAG